MTGLRVDLDHERVALLGAVAHHVLQLRDVLERVQRHHSVVVVGRQQKCCRVLVIRCWHVDVVKGRVPAQRKRRFNFTLNVMPE